ncbi:MAG: T9SS type A sorting domain-containing protein [Bacteroidales bacterium]|nr:T9SS type A sorting domain-containing protein [Bacteroidales bacterium]
MKKLSLILMLLAFSFGMNAQVEKTFDFNDYEYGDNPNHLLNGQDGWYVRVHHAGNGAFTPLYTDYMGHFWGTTPPIPTADETIGVFSDASGTAFGDIATHDITQYGFDFSNGGIIEFECDILRQWWGDFFGIGYDGDGDGSVLPPLRKASSSNAICEPVYPDENSTIPDGGIYLMMTGVNPSNPLFMNGVVLPNNTITSNIQPIGAESHWYRWKVSIDLDANDGQGAVTLFMKYDDLNAEWEAVPECQGVNAGLTPGSGDKYDPAMWHYIYMLNSGWGGFDNFTIRHFPGGLAAQFIDFAEIPDQLVYNAPITLEATSTSGLPVTFEVAQGPATIEGNILTLTGEEGTVKVKAIQAGDGTQWQPAPTVTRTFYVVDPENYEPEITIRRPYEGTKVFMPDFENPVMIVLSAYIEHANAIKFEQVKCEVDGQELYLKTDYPNKPENGYWYTTWTPSGVGTYNMTVSITQTGGKVTTASNTFEVTTDYDDMVVSAMNGEMVATTSQFTDHGEYAFPTHVNAFNAINLHYLHNCVNGNCNTYDHISYVRVKNYRGEWVELCRYITPFGVECIDDLDVTDFTSVLQGLVEFEYYSEQYATGDGYNPTAIFEYTKGTPEYPYVDMQEIWYGNYAFGDYSDPCPIPTRNVVFDPCVEKAKLQITTSGHNWSDTQSGAYNTGNAAEFYHAHHNININGGTTYTQDLWETCSPNPAGCQPQNGTWPHNRAGWCPGSMTLVWDYSLDDYLANGHADVLYEFDPTYVDQCHPNYPDCVSGQNSCPDCENSSNPILRVSGKVVTYSHNTDILTEVPELPDVDAEPFQVSITPNPARGQMTITTDYEKGRASVVIINPQGVKVKGFSVDGQRTIDVSDLPSGMYFVHVIGGKVVTKKVMIQN